MVGKGFVKAKFESHCPFPECDVNGGHILENDLMGNWGVNFVHKEHAVEVQEAWKVLDRWFKGKENVVRAAERRAKGCQLQLGL